MNKTPVAIHSVKQSGFTLVELMVVVAILGVLSAIAYPSYQQHVIKGNRSAAKAEMMEIANRQQQYLLANRSYATQAALSDGGYTLPSDISDKYTLSITLGTAVVPSFEIKMTAKGTQVSDGDLTLDSDGVKTPESKW
jgi:type IV pilus assembly protein PilE